jgi:hypothetical protein
MAGPPFFTDDPEPVPPGHYEFYAFSTVDRAPDGYSVAVPAFEFNLGAVRNLQLHIVVPMQLSVPNDGPREYGIGDIELGAKYRFIQEKGARPQVGTFPMVEAPAGDSSRGLGNGSTIVKLPIWLQKDLGHGWQSYGGGGYLFNPAPGRRNHPFFGWQVQKQFNQKLTLGGEWFTPGQQSFATANTNLLDFGGMCNFTKNFSLLFTAGHSVQGESHTTAYLGLYWTWGSRDTNDKTNSGKGASSVSPWLRNLSRLN